MQKINFETQDGQQLQGFFYPCENPLGTVLVASALGVPQQFYKHYGHFLAQNGYQCVTFDYRGTGLSKFVGNLSDVQLSDWGRLDLNAAIKTAHELAQKNQSNDDNLLLVGHSIGGQVLGLAENASLLKAAIFVASSAPYWRRWPHPRKLYIGFVCGVMLPLLSFARNTYPARAVGLSSMDLPAGCARDWGKWMRDKDYLFGAKFGLPLAGYKEFDKPILSLSFDDDDFAPKVNVDYLLDFYKAAKIENEYISQHSLGLGAIDHMGFFKQKFRNSLWQKSLDWMSFQTQGASKVEEAN